MIVHFTDVVKALDEYRRDPIDEPDQIALALLHHLARALEPLAKMEEARTRQMIKSYLDNIPGPVTEEKP